MKAMSEAVSGFTGGSSEATTAPCGAVVSWEAGFWLVVAMDMGSLLLFAAEIMALCLLKGIKDSVFYWGIFEINGKGFWGVKMYWLCQQQVQSQKVSVHADILAAKTRIGKRGQAKSFAAASR